MRIERTVTIRVGTTATIIHTGAAKGGGYDTIGPYITGDRKDTLSKGGKLARWWYLLKK